MSTGDNLLTSVSIAHKWGILNWDMIATIDVDPETHEIIWDLNNLDNDMDNDLHLSK